MLIDMSDQRVRFGIKTTPMHVSYDDIRTDPWECVRGIYRSFGFNRNSKPEHFLPRDELLAMVADIAPLPGHAGLGFSFSAETSGAARRLVIRTIADGVPPVGEEAMVKAARGKGDSPARAAKRKAPKLPKQSS